jgi:hypothetical protein
VYVVDINVRFYGLGWRSFRANGWNIFDVVVASGSLLTNISVRVGASGYVIDQLRKLFLVSIAFKLVQRMNNLNKLFKTALYVASQSMILLFSPSLLIFASFVLFVQVKFARYFQLALALACSFHVLWHPFRRGF